MHRARIVIALALIWGADIAGAWLLPDRDQVVLNGAAVAVSVAVWIERRAHARAQAAIFEANKREAALIETIGRLTGAHTGPIPALRDVA